MSPLEVALTVFVYGAVLSGALLTIFVCGYLNARMVLIRAQAETEARMLRT